ncbi:MAG: Crp/Fnr family transcriptional regulator [Clostridia bacterium]|nr:Crp/Fnr family transcriptional regulator [Clostridia bacterium]MBQ4574493.1 Crp/Fnr family transcriptional regulator [Clostridia bacterium]
MKNYIGILRNCTLFQGIEPENLTALLGCLGARVERFGRDESIFTEGDPSEELGILLSGSVQILRMDYDGNRSIVANVAPSQLFAEAFACARVPAIPVDVIASSDCEVMLINAVRITHSCSNACHFHNRIILNLLQSMAKKTLMITQKIEVTSKRSTREKLLTYLQLRARENGSLDFFIPFDRQELADYLEVDRSGLSAEISKLRKEGMLWCEKNHFRLLR